MTSPHYWDTACQALARDPELAQLICSFKHETLVSRGDAFTTLLRTITGQQISVRAAASVMQRIESQLGQLTPANLLKQKDQQLRDCGLSRAKVRYCQAMAEFCLDPPDWHTTAPQELQQQLIALPGIGTWSWQMFAIFYLQLPDEFPWRDLGVRKALVQLYALQDDCEIEAPAMQARIKSWQPWRTVATWHLWRSLDPVPVAY